ncbi:MAG: hypothetical protein JJU27_06680 [Gammaproteobacteria bacterium]|nr:hypothetical protein [Gammaproteobacteria bacterium]
MARPIALLFALLLAWMPQASAIDGGGLRVLHHEGLQNARFEVLSASTGHERFEFQAAGRQWTLVMRPNPRLRDHVRDEGTAVLEGRLPGQPDSWARLTRIDGQLWGMVHDGDELWIVEPMAAISAHGAATASVEGTGIYRLADTMIDATAMSCATASAGPAPRMIPGDMAMAMLGAELGRMARGSQNVFAAIPISVVADREFRDRFPLLNQAEEQVLVRMNNADGIYQEQVGVAFDLREIRVLQANPSQLTSSTATELLTGFRQYRANSPSLIQNTSLSHLLTGKSLQGSNSNGQTLGIAYVSSGGGTGVLCNTGAGGTFSSYSSFGAGLTSSRVTTGVTLDSLVISHEIGHNFGAVHDGDADDALCVDTPSSGFIMAASISTNAETFSQCSLDTMLPYAQNALAAGCLLPASSADISVSLPVSELDVTVNQDFSLRVDISNLGTLDATDVTLRTTLPTGIALVTADTGGAACTLNNADIVCELGDLSADAGVSIEHRLRASSAGARDISIAATSNEDSSGTNNLATARVTATAPPPPPPAPASSGGGGAIALPWLLALGLMLGFAARRRPF